ncbi:MAG: efflux RND transporter periplasmic adaptor subunit, partial [Neisseriaceae bacterium]
MQSKQFFDKEEEIIQDDSIFKSIKGINIPKFYPRLSLLIFILLIFSILVMFLPWIQTSSGSGVITSINPEDRLQQIIAPTSGRIIKWYVRDGTFVKTGDNILEISDIDPYNISRLEAEIDAMQLRYDSAKSATSLMLKNLDRQRRLYNSGLSSKREMELANINYQKAVSEQEYYNTQLIKSRANLARQTNQLIKADRDGYIVNTLSSSTSKIVKPGDLLASFLPNTSKYAAEIYISGNDVP